MHSHRASAGDKAHKNARILASVAATIIALSCGTGYGFSAWAPQFANRLQLSATQLNIIGNAINFGMYAMGIPGGYMVDSRGPRWGVLLGCFFLSAGYFALKNAYDIGPGSYSVPMLCLFALCTGMGSCTAFSAAIKASSSNWPTHRGTATAFPLSAFGLSAFFYTFVAGIVFPSDTSGYLKLLAAGTTAMTFFGMLFLRIVPRSHAHDHSSAYGVVPTDDQDQQTSPRDEGVSTRLHKTNSQESRGMNSSRTVNKHAAYADDGQADETSSLFSSGSSGPGDINDDVHESKNSYRGHRRPEVTGIALFKSPKFWQLFILLALLCGVGLMTINNIGNSARSLWRHYDDTASKDFLTKRQLMHVSILSVCSFLGRLASGIGSDWLIHHHLSRFWTTVASGSIFVAAQVVALTLEDPHHLFWLSGSTGIAYGVLFGTYPALVADAFGPTGLGINWGAMTWAPVLSGTAFNILYGIVLDRHSVFKSNPQGRGPGERICDDGRECYRSAYWITLVASIVGVVWTLWCIRQEKVEVMRERREGEREHQP